MVNYFVCMNYFNEKAYETFSTFRDQLNVLLKSGEYAGKEYKIVYLHWRDRCIEVSEDDVITRYLKKYGSGSNKLPHTVLTWLQEHLTEEDAVSLLYVITDGAGYISRDAIMDQNMKINYDISVASIYISNSKRFTIYCNEELVDEIDLSNPFDYEQINVDNFHEKMEQLKSYIKLQFLTKSSSNHMALDEIKKLKQLRTRLFKEIESKEGPSDPVNLNVKDKNTFIAEFKKTPFYRILIQDLYTEKQVIEGCISTLINYINDDKKSFRFDNLKFTQKFTPAAEEEVFSVDFENAEEILFPDVIMSNETGIPVILLTHYSLIDNILFKNEEDTQTAHFSRFRYITDCPLMLLHDDDFKSSVEYFYNLEAFKGMVEHGIQTGPRTRQNFTGAIVPLEEFDEYNDYILSSTYFDKRRVPYNKGLLYYVLYKTCEKLEYIEPNVVEYLKRYVLKRIEKTECFLGLNSVSIDDPIIRVNLTTALWYCVELSSIIFKNDPKHYTKERMRMYSNYVEYMMEILEWFNYSVDTSSVNLRADIFKHVNQLKRIPRAEDKAMFILEQIFEKKDNFLVSNIVNPSNIYKLHYINMDPKKVIDEGLLSSEVDLHKFAHFLDYVEREVPLCKQTLRPRFVTEDKKSFYEQLKSKSKKVVIQNGQVVLEPVSKLNISKVLSLYKLFIFYVQTHLEFPTLEQYKLFVLKKKMFFRGKPIVFATDVLVKIENIFKIYEEVIYDKSNPIDVTTFSKITKQSVNRENRIRTENPDGFDLTKISDYIKQSENYVVFDSEQN